MTLTAPRTLVRRAVGRSGGRAGEGDAPPAARWRLHRPSWALLVLAAVAYIPLLFTAPGKIGADTKAYLYLDPGTMLRRAMSMWDPHVSTGGVTHQNIGYLFPQGLYYWLLSLTGLPIWVAQRLWTGSVLFAAGAGVIFLLRSFRWPDRYAFIAAFAYMLSPYLLEYEARMSIILLPWSGLAWMIGLAVRGLRVAQPGRAGWRLAGWRYPAAFGLTVTLVGSINASSLIFVLLAPLLWVPFAVWGTGEATWRSAGGMFVRTLLALFVTSAWWMSGLLTQGRYGLDVLAYTETVQTVASSSQASEVLRGLGNWYFYGRDALGEWIGPAGTYTRMLVVILISFTVPVLALVAAGAIRWAHRAYFVALTLLGTAIAVGAYPYHQPSPLGGTLKAFATGSTVGLALRSMPRAVPLVALGMAVLLAGGVAAYTEAATARRAAARQAPDRGGRALGRLRRGPATGWLPAGVGVVVVALIAANMAPLWEGRSVDPGLDRPEHLPAYETALGKALTAEGTSTRTLELPGADFSHYRWGTTLDPVTTGLTDRSVISRQLVPDGEPASADLVRALDRRLQEGVLDPSSLADIARLLGVGSVELRSDVQYERYRTPRPQETWNLFTAQRPAGLTAPRAFGPKISDTPQIPYTDETTLGAPANEPDPPAIALFGVTDPDQIARAETTRAPIVVSGDGEGLVDASASGLLAQAVKQHRTVLYTAALLQRPGQLQQALANGAELVVTDSNRLRAQRWSSLRENYGYVEQVGVKPLTTDLNNNPLPLFPGAGTDSQTVAQLAGTGERADIASVQASDYGNTVTYAPADQPGGAVDGSVNTAWRVGAFTNPVGARLRVTLKKPVTAGQITLTQPITGSRNRWITQATVRFDGGRPVTVNLDDSSRTAAGQVVRFPSRTFSTLDITVAATSAGVQPDYSGLSAVGLANVTIGAPGAVQPTDEVLRLPTDLLSASGASSLQHQLVVQLSRDRANPAEPFKSDTEPQMGREFSLPTARTFAVTGTARVSALAPDPTVDAMLGRSTNAAVVRANSSGRLPGDLGARASSAFDNDPSTFWSPGAQGQVGNWLQVTSPTPVTFSSMNLSVVADGRHSVPTRIGLVVDGRRVRELTVPPITDVSKQNGTATAHLTFPAVHGSNVRVVIDAVREVKTKDSISGQMNDLPVGIAEAGIAGLRVPVSVPAVPSSCRTDLLTIDGKRVGVRISGSTTAAANREGLTATLCGAPVHLAAGPHVLRTAPGSRTGIDLDRLTLGSDAGGGPAAITATGDVVDASAATAATRAAAAAVPTVSVVKSGDTSYTLKVTGATAGSPFWLVLGESLSAGWKATVGSTSLGAPRLVDGYANGWTVTPTASSFTVHVVWTPQRVVWGALALSAVAIPVAVLVEFLTWPGRRRRRKRRGGPLGATSAGAGGTAGAATLTVAAVPATADLPRLEPWRTGGRPATTRLTVLITLAAAALAGILIAPGYGLLVGLLALVALRWPRWRLVLRIGGAVALAASAAYVLEVQARYHLPTSGDWVSAFHKVGGLSWLAIILIAVDVAVAFALRRSASDRPVPPAAPAASEASEVPEASGASGASGASAAPEAPATPKARSAPDAGADGRQAGRPPGRRPTANGPLGAGAD